jgi:tetratricopeptide (TPR) repeat protein
MPIFMVWITGRGDVHVIKSLAFILCYLLCWPIGGLASENLFVIVFPLDGPPKSPLQWLGEGIAMSLSDQLNSREIKSMGRNERTTLVENLDLPPGARLSRGSMIRVAQRAGSDLLIMGAYSGSEQNLRVSVRVLNVKNLKLSGEMVANGPLSALPQMENELAWLILTNNGIAGSSSREKFQERTRKVSNQAYAYYVKSFDASNESDQLHLLLKAVESYRNFPEAQYRLGKIYFRKGDCASAIPHLVLGQKETGPRPEGDFMKGICYLQSDLPDQAIQAFESLLQVSRPFEALNNVGVAYLRKGDTAPAVEALIEARNLARTDPTVSLNLAVARHLQGNNLAARAILEEACKSHPQNGMLQFVTGIVLKAQGEGEKAAIATGKAKNLGINVEKLAAEPPAKWSRVLSSLEGR